MTGCSARQSNLADQQRCVIASAAEYEYVIGVGFKCVFHLLKCRNMGCSAYEMACYSHKYIYFALLVLAIIVGWNRIIMSDSRFVHAELPMCSNLGCVTGYNARDMNPVSHHNNLLSHDGQLSRSSWIRMYWLSDSDLLFSCEFVTPHTGLLLSNYWPIERSKLCPVTVMHGPA